MGKKIHPNLFRQLNIFKDLQTTSIFFLVQKRFFHEIEIRWFLSQAFSQKGFDLQQVFYEQSFSKGFLVRFNFVSLNSLNFFSNNKKNSAKRLVPKFRVPRSKFMSSSTVRTPRKFLKQYRSGLNLRKKLICLQSLKSKTMPIKVFGVSSAPLFLGSTKLRVFLRLLHRLLQRFKHLENFSTTLLITTLSLSFPGFLDVFASNLVKIFFKTRRHSARLKFLQNLITLVFKNNKNFSRILGFLMQLRGRLDKRPRTELYRISLGKLQRQSFVANYASKNLQAITKNGTFGIFVYFRFPV